MARLQYIKAEFHGGRRERKLLEVAIFLAIVAVAIYVGSH